MTKITISRRLSVVVLQGRVCNCMFSAESTTVWNFPADGVSAVLNRLQAAQTVPASDQIRHCSYLISLYTASDQIRRWSYLILLALLVYLLEYAWIHDTLVYLLCMHIWVMYTWIYNYTWCPWIGNFWLIGDSCQGYFFKGQKVNRNFYAIIHVNFDKNNVLIISTFGHLVYL